MIWLLLSYLVFVIHLLFLLFIAIGGVWVWKKKIPALSHVLPILWAMANVIFAITCPLTPIENYLRIWGGATPYTTSYIQYYLQILFQSPDWSLLLQNLLEWGVVVFNAALYLFLLFRKKLAPSR